MAVQDPVLPTSSLIASAQRPAAASRSGAVTATGTASRVTAGIPPSVLVMLSACSLEFGGALAKTLFATLGPAGTVMLRAGLAAIALLLLWRPRLRHVTGSRVGVILLFGLSMAAMNLTFYLAVSRVPFGVAVTIEMLGPLCVAAFGTRRLRDLLWVLLAAVGIAAFAPLGTPQLATAIDPLGIALSMLSGVFTALYILMSARTGRTFADGAGLALAMVVAAILLLPLGVATAGPVLVRHPQVLVTGAGVALLSSVVPYSLEIAALRRMPPRVFGVLVSLEPALASLAGWLVLHEQLGVRSLVAIALVTAASMGAARSGHSGRS